MRKIESAPSARSASAVATAKVPDKKHAKAVKTDGDSFKTGKPSKLDPLRPAGAAVTFVEKFEKGLKLSPDVEKQRAKNMKASVISFYRANPGLFFMDQRQAYGTPLLGRPAPKVVIGGDTHLGNFGVIRGPAPKHEAVWSLNDFDQAGVGSPEADLERLAASAVLTARAKGYGADDQRELVHKIAKAYVHGVHEGGAGHIDSKAATGFVQDVLDQANTQTRHDLLHAWVHKDRFRESSDLKPLTGAAADAVMDGVKEYGKQLNATAPVILPLQVLDVGQRFNAGGSTLGLERYYALVAGKDDKKPRILELKQVPPPAVEGSSSDLSKAKPAEVVARADALTGFKSPLLGALTIHGKPMLVREVEPEKVRKEPTELNPKQLEDLAEQAAAMLARSHGHKRELEAWIGDDKKALEHHLADFAVRYANQAQADWQAYVQS